MDKVKILWADDEIELLKPHILFLEQKNYSVTAVKSGDEAIEKVEEHHFDVVFLDENMPGITGLDALISIKKLRKSLPVVMITKSEEEHIMEEAIGSEISDYLIKPVNPNQILLSLKKILDNSRLITEKSTIEYQKEFREISMLISDRIDSSEWIDVQKKLVYWDLKLSKGDESGMGEILKSQKLEANNSFCKFIEGNYLDWLNNSDQQTPILSHTLLKHKLIPKLSEGSTFLVVLDCLRYDQWRILQPEFSKHFIIEEDDCYFSILPTATQFARNSLFAGLLPSEIEKRFPKLWVNENEDERKNEYEEDLLRELLKRCGKSDKKMSFNKITNLYSAKKLLDNFHQLKQNDLNVIVYNFVDTLSHARTDFKVMRELADDEKGYRSITKSWFENSPLLEMLKLLKGTDSKVILTTDHGAVLVDNPRKVVGDKNISNNLRYKAGKNMQYKAKDVFEIDQPQDAFLPKLNISTRYIFAKNSDFFAYPNNYNHYSNHYKNTLQHGGVSMDEMIVPIITMKSK
ncbi:MAG: two-component system response regulator [Flavobacteriales bacterium]|nr:two-component system response regulator [Flavobacteriales bacterium]MBO73565.1 two-component system response regulator [Flavobacteriales bacterium]|tara:strand:- start:285 stop:1838 length:1554 start_codon:yes stop_codon:yes gene_type:complete